ncbi:MAG: ABC transporter permease [Candidatus Heimdallarchaeota archaeon]
MSVFDRSYRTYQGELRGRFPRIWAIAANTFNVQFRRKRTIFLLIASNFPVIAFTFMLVFMAIFLPSGGAGLFFSSFLGSLDESLFLIIASTFNAGSIFMPIVFMGAINSGVIANDKKQNSLALYMSRPIDRMDYVFGKGIAVLMVNSFVTYLPWLMYMLVSTLLSGMTGAQFAESIWVYFAALGAAIIMMIFFGAIILLFSSISEQSILAGIMFILILFLPSVIASGINQAFDFQILSYFSVSDLMLSMVSLLFGNPETMLGFLPNFLAPDINGWVSLTILLTISVISFLIVIRRMQKEEIH